MLNTVRVFKCNHVLEFNSIAFSFCVIVGCKFNLLPHVSRGYFKADLCLISVFAFLCQFCFMVIGKRTAVNDL